MALSLPLEGWEQKKIKRLPGTPSQRDRLQTKDLSWTSGNKYVKEGFSEDPEE